MKQKIVHGAVLDVATYNELAELLQKFGESGHVAFGSDSIERELENWPVIGGRRQIRVAKTRGDNGFVVPVNQYTDLLDQDAGRGGLSIVNIGANPCFVFLTDAQTARDQQGHVASGYLAANGGAWDGKIGNAEWVGKVSVLSVLGTTLVFATV